MERGTQQNTAFQSAAPAGSCLMHPHPQGHLHCPIRAQTVPSCPEKVLGSRSEVADEALVE